MLKGAREIVSVGSGLRRVCGRTKWRVQCGVARLMHEKRGPLLRMRFEKEIEKIPCLERSGVSNTSVHMLCGIKTVDMGIWSSWSLMRFMLGSDFVIHSDGTLSREEIGRWRRVIPWLRVVEARGFELSAGLRGRYPQLEKWRGEHFCGAQILDFHLGSEQSYVMGLDSDVLFFRDPRELKAVGGVENTEFVAMKDLGYAYAAPLEEINGSVGFEVPALINGGCYASRRFGEEDFELMELALSGWHQKIKSAYWSTQTLLAVAAARKKHCFLPATYDIHIGRTRRECVARHYVSAPHTPIRARFFTEGLVRLRREMNA